MSPDVDVDAFEELALLKLLLFFRILWFAVVAFVDKDLNTFILKSLYLIMVIS
jgi:hypothetical protein